MIKWFRKNKRNERDLEHQLIAMRDQIALMQQSIEQLSTRSQITVHHLQVHQPVIEKVEYRLDKLDIDHLSGSLNLGNNFGTKPLPTTATNSSITTTSNPPPSPSTASNDLEATSRGFKVRRC